MILHFLVKNSKFALICYEDFVKHNIKKYWNWDVGMVDKKSAPPIIEYNDRDQKSFTKNGLQIPENLNYQERNFLSKVSTKQELGHKIRREVTKIVRVKARDYNSTKL